MYASWLIVENARTLLMSKFASAIEPANRAVNPPIPAMIRIAVQGTADTRIPPVDAIGTRKMNDRAVRYTPAFTIVAAWIRAETVVGPSIASGSHAWSGNCALLPTAPPNRRSGITVKSCGVRVLG